MGIMVFFIRSYSRTASWGPRACQSILYNSLTCCTRVRSALVARRRSSYVYFFFGAGFAAGGGAAGAALAGAFGASVCFAAPPIMSRKLSPFLLCSMSVRILGPTALF